MAKRKTEAEDNSAANNDEASSNLPPTGTAEADANPPAAPADKPEDGSPAAAQSVIPPAAPNPPADETDGEQEASPEELNRFKLNSGLTQEVLQPDGSLKTIEEIRAEFKAVEVDVEQQITERAAASVQILSDARAKLLAEDALKVS